MRIVQIVDLAFQIYMLMLFARILSSWVPEIMRYRFMQFIAQCTDPYLDFFRRFIPPIGMIDISPIFAFFALSFIEKLILLLIY